jgi:hypothetical protein
MRKRSISVACLLLTACIARGQDAAAPATAPAEDNIPVADMSSKFDYHRMANELIAKYDKDPIGRIAKDMGEATSLLTQLKTNDPTQPQQQQIVASLDALIAMLEKQQKKMKAGGGLNPNRPLPDSVIAKGPGGMRDMNDPNASNRQWGQLPPKQREQILQSQNEGFPAGFEAILSSYYKRLAAESVDGGAQPSAAPAPTTRP